MPDKVESNKEQALSRALQQIEKAFGKGSIMHLDETQGAAVDGMAHAVRVLSMIDGSWDSRLSSDTRRSTALHIYDRYEP